MYIYTHIHTYIEIRLVRWSNISTFNSSNSALHYHDNISSILCLCIHACTSERDRQLKTHPEEWSPCPHRRCGSLDHTCHRTSSPPRGGAAHRRCRSCTPCTARDNSWSGTPTPHSYPSRTGDLNTKWGFSSSPLFSQCYKPSGWSNRMLTLGKWYLRFHKTASSIIKKTILTLLLPGNSFKMSAVLLLHLKE